MNNNKNKAYENTLNIVNGEVDAKICKEILYLLKNTNMTEDEIRNKFHILNGYDGTERNFQHQRLALYKMKQYRKSLEKEIN